MAKNYCFEFSGTKEDFLNTLSKYPGYDNKYYYFDDYIVEIESGEYKFGVARSGHSDGYWYLPETLEKGGSLCFTGQIKRLSHHTTEKSTERGIEKALNIIVEILFLVFLLPFLLIIKCYSLIDSLIRKLKKIPKEMTTEERLFDLMVNHLNCNEILKTDR